MEKIKLNSNSQSVLPESIDPKVKKILEENEVHQIYPTQNLQYKKINAPLNIPELKDHSEIWIREYDYVIENKDILATPKKDKKKIKSISKSKKKKKKTDSEEDDNEEENEANEMEETSEEFINNFQEIFGKNKFGNIKRIKLAVPFNNKKKISFWNLVKDLVGKDLTKISIPVYLNEPASMLQRMLEAFEYIELLEKATKEQDRYKRLILVCSFIFTQYACTQNRNKKPFNPLLGETFEYEFGNYRILSEQVSHHPPVSAFHIENDELLIWGHVQLKSKFSVSGLDVSTSGNFH